MAQRLHQGSPRRARVAADGLLAGHLVTMVGRMAPPQIEPPAREASRGAVQALPGAVQALPGAAMARLTLPRAPAAVRQTRAGGGTVPEGAPGAERAPVGHQ